MGKIGRRELLKRGGLAAGSAMILGAMLPSSEPMNPAAQLGGPMDVEQIQRLIRGGLIFFVNAYDGVDPAGIRDSTVGIQSVLDMVPNGGGVVVFHGKYVISSPLRPKDGTTLRGLGWSTGSDPNSPAQLLGASMTRPAIERADDSRSVTIDGLVLRGNPRSSTSLGIRAAEGYNWVVRDTLLLDFGGPAIDFDGGYGSVFSHIYAHGLTVRSGWSEWTGVLRLGGSDCRLDFVEATAGTNNDLWAGTDHLAALCIRGSFHLITNCIGEYSAVGFVLTEEPSGQNLMMNSRGEFNNGHGWIIDQPMNSLVQCHAYCNSRAGDNLYDGFVISQPHNTLVACRTLYQYQYPTRHRYGFVEQLSDPGGPPERAFGNYTLFLGCRNTDPPASGEYYFSGTGQKAWIGASNRGVETPLSCIRVASGATGSRPPASAVGQAAMWYDTTLHKPIWSDGDNWRDATGAIV